jgi:CRP-like cAMP-binding protein
MGTNPELATALALHGHAMRVPRGAVIMQPGEEADGLYIVRSGRVKLQLMNHQGLPVWTRTVSEYAMLGLPVALGQRGHCFQAVAAENAEVVYVSTKKLASLVLDRPDLGMQILVAVIEETNDLRRKRPC